jgi:hypothetical protein
MQYMYNYEIPNYSNHVDFIIRQHDFNPASSFFPVRCAYLVNSGLFFLGRQWQWDLEVDCSPERHVFFLLH